MARKAGAQTPGAKLSVRLIDALDGTEAHEIVTFSIDGKPRQIELSHENARKFRALMQPYMEASKPADPTNLAAKGTPRQGKTAYREENAAIRAWAHKHRLPINPLGRIPEMTRKAWERHTFGNDPSLLNQLLAKAGIDPAEIAEGDDADNVFSINGKPIEDQLVVQARKVGKLTAPQEHRLRKACADDAPATFTATDPTDRTSYEALTRRGCMRRLDDRTYEVTSVGRTWVRLRDAKLTA
ncbi:Lsr2 family protein [Streptomyces albus]|uniref:histone-like nucleoid-structuring protein Lsr2 n=1 Tax=Streptomyces albus TaxID=1888 RepID=UPI0036F9131B